MWIVGTNMAASFDSSPHTVQNSKEDSNFSGIVLFLHGAGDTGPGVESWTRSAMDGSYTSPPTFTFPHLTVIYPTAPKRKYTAGRGHVTTVWFDWPKIDPSIPEDRGSIDPICQSVCSYIDDLIAQGTPAHRIVLGGLSMGGVLALHAGYRYKTQLAGVFALSTFLHNGSIVYKVLEGKPAADKVPPLFCAHGHLDNVIEHNWGKSTFETLEKLGVEGSFHSYDHLHHSMCSEELKSLQSWILSRIPDDQ